VVVDAVFWLIFSLKRMRGCGSDPYRVNAKILSVFECAGGCNFRAEFYT
jgi:hypothetical protein